MVYPIERKLRQNTATVVGSNILRFLIKHGEEKGLCSVISLFFGFFRKGCDCIEDLFRGQFSDLLFIELEDRGLNLIDLFVWGLFVPMCVRAA